jgi:sec-independent protein translocase protein TatC
MSEEMSFWDHLEELRWCIFRVLAALAAAFVGVFIALPYIFDDWILGPSKADFFSYKWIGLVMGDASDVPIININVASQFLTHMSTSLWIALLVVFPYLLYQIWVFVKPALYSGELRGVRTAFVGSTLLFYAGCALCYVIIFPVTFKFLTGYRLGGEITNTISLNSYMSIFLTMTFVMGLVFELPVLCWLLGKFGVVSRGTLRAWRRYAVVVLLVLAAFITPTGDPFTLMVVFLPLYLLYELSIALVPPGSQVADTQ